MRFNEFLVLLVFILLDLQTGPQAVFSKKRREVSWWIWDYYPLQSITEKYASSDFQLRATMEQYKHDLSGHNLALRIQKYMYVDGTSEVQISQAYPPTNITDHTLNYLKNLWMSLENRWKQYSMAQESSNRFVIRDS